MKNMSSDIPLFFSIPYIKAGPDPAQKNLYPVGSGSVTLH